MSNDVMRPIRVFDPGSNGLCRNCNCSFDAHAASGVCPAINGNIYGDVTAGVGNQTIHVPEPTPDEINAPPHYMLFPDAEAIDIIETVLTREQLIGFYKGQVLKYRLRAGEKGPPEKCLAKANWYRNRLYQWMDKT